MKKELFIIGSVVLLLTIGLSGCTEEEDINANTVEMAKFVGSWNASEVDVFNFSADGTCKYVTTLGAYSIKNSQLVVVLENGLTRTYDYDFSVNNTVLTLRNIDLGDTTVYTKQE